MLIEKERWLTRIHVTADSEPSTVDLTDSAQHRRVLIREKPETGSDRVNMTKLNVKRKIFRYWYYFRIGYATYLSYLLGIGSTIITIYYLMIKSIPTLQSIFPNLYIFAAAFFLVGTPLAVGVGFIHFKRTGAYASEVDISQETNPFNFKPYPGKERELYLPFTIIQIDIFTGLAKQLGILTPELQQKLDELRGKFQVLTTGKDYRVVEKK